MNSETFTIHKYVGNKFDIFYGSNKTVFLNYNKHGILNEEALYIIEFFQSILKNKLRFALL